LESFDDILLFVQDSLSVEDFTKYGTSSYSYLSTVFGGSKRSHVYIPRVLNAVESCEESLGQGRKVTQVKETEDPSKIASSLKAAPRNLVIVSLSSEDGDSRGNSLKSQDERVKKIVEAVSKKNSNVLVIYAGRKPALAELKRSKREITTKGITMDGKCIDIVTDGIKVETKFADAPKTSELPAQFAEVSDEICTEPKTRSAVYEVKTGDADLKDLRLSFHFKSDEKDWELAKVMADYSTEKLGKKKEELTTAQKIKQKIGKEFSALNPISFTSADKKISLTFENIKVNPFPQPKREKLVRDSPEALPSNVYFNIPMFSVMTIGLLYFFIMYWALGNIMSIKTMDQYDDPRGKTITIPNVDG
jgi:hypothetical protein